MYCLKEVHSKDDEMLKSVDHCR